MATHATLPLKTLHELELAHLYSHISKLPYCYSKTYNDKAPETFINPFWLSIINDKFGYDFSDIDIETHFSITKQMGEKIGAIRDGKEELLLQLGRD